MKFLGNIFWLLLGGIIIAFIYYMVGLLMCITIVGIPFGIQLFKLGTYSLWPFGHELVDGPNEPGCLSTVMNLIWRAHLLRHNCGNSFRPPAFQDGPWKHIPVWKTNTVIL